MKYLTTRSDDGTELRLARWGDAERDVLIVHGLAEHVDRYDHVAEALVAAGWRVTAVELRGHGKSGGKRGHVRYWHKYCEDVQAAAATVQRPFVLLGHSMGGLVTLSTLRQPITPAVRAVALSNPLLGVAVEGPKWKITLAKLLSRLLPALPLTNELDTKLISRDPEVVRKYENDPLVFSVITPRWYTEMTAALESVNQRAGSYTLPLRLMTSTADQICDPKAAQAFGRAYGGEVTAVSYEGLYHELFNELERERVIAELIEWLNGLPG